MVSPKHLSMLQSPQSPKASSSRSIKLSWNSVKKFKCPKELKKDKGIFIILDLKHEGLNLFIFKYIFMRVYVTSLFGLIYSYILSEGFNILPFICFDDNFKEELYSQGICFCRDPTSKFMTYLRRNLLVVNILAFCNLEALNGTRKISTFTYFILYGTIHGLSILLHLISPEDWQYFLVSSLTFLLIFVFFYSVSHIFFLKNPQRRDYNIQFCGVFMMFILNFLIYCFLNGQFFGSIRFIFFGNQYSILAFVLIFHFIMIYISSARDTLVEKCKPKGLLKESIITTTNCVFSCTKMGFFLALNITQLSFYFNAVCLIYSNLTHSMNFLRKKLFFILKCHRCKIFKKLGLWKICLRSSLDKKLINGSFIFERFLNYYVLFYIYISGKYFVDPLDTQNYAKSCTLDLKDDFLIDKMKILAYVFTDCFSILLILVVNRIKNLDEIKYRTPEQQDPVKEVMLFLGVYYYSHYLFVLGFYVKYYVESMQN